MFGVGYFKGEPTDHLPIFHGKKLARKGAGLAFYYWRAEHEHRIDPDQHGRHALHLQRDQR